MLQNSTSPKGAYDRRDQFIPVRKTDIITALLKREELRDLGQDEKFRQLCQLLASIFHYESLTQLEHLRDGYFYFNPELITQSPFSPVELDAAYRELTTAFAAVLKGANFFELTEQQIEDASRERPFFRVKVRAPMKSFRDVRFFARGRHKETVRIHRWLGLYRKSLTVDVFSDVVLLIATKSLNPGRSKPAITRLFDARIRPGAVFLKYFRNIVANDLATLFPNIRVVMGRMDKLLLGLPAVVAGAPIIIKVASTISVLLVALGFYALLDIPHTLEPEKIQSALAGVSALAALGGFLMSQWVRYERQSLKYQKQITDNVYFHNINNNAGIFDYLIGAAEEQECKEAFLAYYFLLFAKEPPTQEELDSRIEHWLLETFGFDIDFEVDDALAKLDRLQLLVRDGARLSVLGLDDALARLDYLWDNFFQFNREGSGAVTAK